MKKIIDFLLKNIGVVILSIVLFGTVFVYFTKNTLSKKTTYTVINSSLEYVDETNLYVIKKENIVDYDRTQAIIPIVEQGRRTGKNEPIATYKNDSFDDYSNQIHEIDEKIQVLVKDLPVTYSADVASIEKKILNYSNEVQGVTSYSKMIDYKAILDELAYKKISILANASPDNSAIKELIKQREQLMKNSKMSDNVIFSDYSGIITYKLDGVEDSYDFYNIEDYSDDDFDKLIENYNNLSNDYGIKIVDNFSVYFLVKTDKSENNENYIEEGDSYTIRISDYENKTVRSKLIKNIEKNNTNYSLFHIAKDVDDLVDARKLSCEVVWKKIEGMAVPINAIYTDKENKFEYILMVYGTEYIKVPINVVAKTDSIAIVENVDDDVRESYGVERYFKLEVYDELVIDEKGN